MSNYAIRVQDLGKTYRIGGSQEKYRTIRDAITSTALAPLRRTRDVLRGQAYAASGLQEEIWALKDLTFDIQHGEVVGIIGRNGAGKSTLLKILSRITEPSTGYADVYGRVGALLEVGTGFHPELTGRENVYLNGAILGMGRRDIERRFDEIVSFAGVEKFVDTPFKHFSSGMGLRLGFAVAAHLETEILFVDEVLAVGDTQFQKKCLGKMNNIANEGRTVLFVSHSMATIRGLCTRGILLERGSVRVSGEIDEVISAYQAVNDEVMRTVSLEDRKDRSGSGDCRIVGIDLLNDQGNMVDTLHAGEKFAFRLHYRNMRQAPLRYVSFVIRIDDYLGTTVFALASEFTGQDFDTLPDEGSVIAEMDAMPLVEGEYRVMVFCRTTGRTADHVFEAFKFSVEEADVYGSGKFPKRKWHGNMWVPQNWRLE
ncbi:MAG: ABC transporter ATP-binding protein [Anaerolineae bacterium]